MPIKNGFDAFSFSKSTCNCTPDEIVSRLHPSPSRPPPAAPQPRPPPPDRWAHNGGSTLNSFDYNL
eukprot:gene15659-11206_t